MFEITASGRLSADPWEGSRTHIDGSHVPVVCSKDDRITVSGEARAIKVSTDGQPFIEVTACSIVPHHMAEAKQDYEPVVH